MGKTRRRHCTVQRPILNHFRYRVCEAVQKDRLHVDRGTEQKRLGHRDRLHEGGSVGHRGKDSQVGRL